MCPNPQNSGPPIDEIVGGFSLLQMIYLDTGVITNGDEQKFCFVVAMDDFIKWIEVRVFGC